MQWKNRGGTQPCCGLAGLRPSSLLLRLGWMLLLAALPAIAATDAELAAQLDQRVKPFLAAYCTGCHSGQNAAAQFDLTQYTGLGEVIRDHPRWALLSERLSAKDMPPKGMKQPPDEQRQQIIAWVEAVRDSEARKGAGDPGPVLVRRLSNAEYNYTIRDLTGVDIAPANEFPVDPANPAGFDNSGESLAMSPSLLNKYLQAARQVGDHLVLKPQGIAFAPHPMLAESDREKYTIQRIVEFYDRQPTDYADYFEAAWRYKHRAALGKPGATLASLAAEAKISPKYLPQVWEILEQPMEEVGPMLRLRTMWRHLPEPGRQQPELLREACVKMRDFVGRIRKLTACQFASPMIRGLSGTSQPLMNWKLRSFAEHRRDFDRSALQVEGEAPPELPVMPEERGANKDTIAVRNEIIAVKARYGDPDLIVPAGQRDRYEAAFARFSSVFPDAFYIRERGRFYPDDSEDKGRLLSAGFHNVMGYFRDDIPLQELILDEEGKKELDRLWLEFDFIADYTTRTYVQYFFNQSGEIEGRGRESGSFRPGDKEVTSAKVIFGLRDVYVERAQETGNKVAIESINDHFARVNATIRMIEKARLDAEPTHLDGLLDFAARAYRRPLTQTERKSFLDYYESLRKEKALSHEEAMRDLVVLVLMSPDFCYRIDLMGDGALISSGREPKGAVKNSATTPIPVEPLSDYALASRLSYFLWSSLPDKTLLDLAAAGKLHRPEVLSAQVRRMLKDDRSKALAVEFAGNWLEFRRFQDHAGVDRQRFPVFTDELREAMYEEPVRFIDDIIRNDQSALELLYGRHTFVNNVLARHYGIDRVRLKPGQWVKIDDAREYGRGGLLPMAVFLTRNSPGLRTSPVKRGYWVVKDVLGEVIPPPPPTVPELPSDESKMDLPLRQMLANHRENPSCAACHARFDSLGLSLEGYGPVGERRVNDLAGRLVDAHADFPGGGEGNGIEGLVDYIHDHRENDFVENLCRKMFSYALGRTLLLTDQPQLEAMRTEFIAKGHHFSTLIESVVKSPQFLNKRSPVMTD